VPVWVGDANVSFQQGEEDVESLSSVAKGTKPQAEGPSQSCAFASNGKNKREWNSDSCEDNVADVMDIVDVVYYI